MEPVNLDILFAAFDAAGININVGAVLVTGVLICLLFTASRYIQRSGKTY